MVTRIPSATLVGVEARSVDVEVHVARGLPSMTIVGLPDAAVREGGMAVVELAGEAAERYLDMAFETAWSRLKEAGSPHYEALRAAYYDR